MCARVHTLFALHFYCLQVSGGANIANSTTQNPVAASMGTLPLSKQVALMTAVVSWRVSRLQRREKGD